MVLFFVTGFTQALFGTLFAAISAESLTALRARLQAVGTIVVPAGGAAIEAAGTVGVVAASASVNALGAVGFVTAVAEY
jgi:hypothetical protein